MIYQPRKGKTFLFERSVRVHVINRKCGYTMFCSIPCLCSSDWGMWRIVKAIGRVRIEDIASPYHNYPVYGRSLADDLLEKDRLN